MAKDSRFNGRTVEEMRVYAPNNGSLAYKSDYLYDTRLAAAQPKRDRKLPRPQKPSQRFARRKRAFRFPSRCVNAKSELS